MFLLNEILVFTSGRRQEALDRLAWIHGLMASKPGFRQAIVARYLGDGFRHTVLRIWESEEAFQEFRQGPDGNYGRGRPPGLYTNETVVPQWNGTLESLSEERGTYLVKVQREVPEELRSAFDEQQKRIQAIRLSLGSLLSFGDFTAKDRSERLLIFRFRDRADHERLLDHGDIARELEAQPAGAKLISRQSFEVVSEVGPA